MEIKHLYRSDKNKIFSGIIGGIAEYFEVDAAILRTVWILILVFTGFFPGIIAYILAMFVIPKNPN